ncbi:hypothetical protein [Natronomonas marina]|jgi:hypothetical protein|uniref:hypothetical protein n=1 Tax=Natronomonas marina TaxID=2961939 RepID=UPI0020C9E8B8|nr:hypothetical protein [Natronomonas marina]
MSSISTLRDRIRPGAFIVVVLLVGGATYFEFLVTEPSPYSFLLWIILVPLLLVSAAVKGVRSHRLYRPLTFGSFIAIGVLQYLDGEWYLLAGLFVLAGIGGLISALLSRETPAPS